MREDLCDASLVPINVPIGDPLNDDQTMIDLSTLNLNELLVLLYRLQQQSEHSSRDKPKQDRSPTLCRRLSAFNLSNLADAPKHLTNTLSQLPSSLHSRTNTSIHSPNDVVVKLEQSLQMQEKVIDSSANCCGKHLSLFEQMKSRRLASSSSIYSYHHSQQHKAKVISNLLSSHVHHR